ncbi:hypothetical protein [Alicyclobacillus ferrooxydans]|uniref:Type II secretion system protein GspF domain-containing protein n=1 Tax=Alicyclobacillus ferrooxydans TaxID=471514 RepID=A0A0P9CB44_9BACL|nr:hypothetical protein [Alicyclobacillus ferrooxydans]KPV42689.1 hypothetical protein AN477_16285 [Alicyclobacillus ferrooxydans]
MGLVFTTLLIIGVIVSVVLYVRTHSSETFRVTARARLLNQWKTVQIKTSEALHDAGVQQAFRNAGLSVSAQTYYIVRAGLSLLGLYYGIYTYYHSGNPFVLVAPIAVWLLLGYKRPWAIYWLLLTLAKQRQQQQAQDLFRLVAHVKQELELRINHHYSVREIVARAAPGVPRLRAPILRLVTFWPQDPKAALLRFAEEVTSTHTMPFVMALLTIDESNPEVGFPALQNIYDQFEKDLVSGFHSRIKLRDLVVFSLSWLFIFLAAWPTLNVFLLYTQSLLKFSLMS